MSDTVRINPTTGTAESELASPADLDLQAVRDALGREYEVFEELGRGGMAIVYRGRDRHLDREVAIKVLPRARVFDTDFVDRFLREARTAALLEHPQIVPIYRVGREGDVIYFVMKYLRGDSLAKRLERRGQLSPDTVWQVLSEVAEAIDCASARGVVHRDIKPDNIIFDEQGRAVVTDFGIAMSAREQRGTGEGVSVGTPQYMSPEQAQGAVLDVRSDLYSLGVVAYQALCGHVPFNAEDPMAILFAHASKPVPRPPLPTPEHEAVYRIIEQLLQKDPAVRVQDGQQLVVLLHDAWEPEGASTPVTPIPAPRTSGGTKRGSPNASAATTLVARGRARWAAARRSTRVVCAGALVAGLGATGSYAVHQVEQARSTCPKDARMATSFDASRPILVLMDRLGRRHAGGDLSLHYDVCGLPAGMPFTVEIRLLRWEDVWRAASTGGQAPAAMTFEEHADGPATRRHGDIDLVGLDAGRYALQMVVTDRDGRRGQRSQELRLE